MANEKNLKPFKKGQSGNPQGGRLHNKDLKMVRALTQQDIAEVGAYIIQGNVDELKKIQSNPASTVFKVWVCSIAIKAINKGDAQALNVILDRIVGRVKESIQIQGTLATSTTPLDEAKFLELNKKLEESV